VSDLSGSRGAIFDMAAVAFALVSRRMSALRSMALAGVVIAALVLDKFGGGRGLSLHEGNADGRLMAWGSGISQLCSDPLFGTGFRQFTGYADLTAHNSFVRCFADTGFFGYFFWLARLVSLARD